MDCLACPPSPLHPGQKGPRSATIASGSLQAPRRCGWCTQRRGSSRDCKCSSAAVGTASERPGSRKRQRLGCPPWPARFTPWSAWPTGGRGAPTPNTAALARPRTIWLGTGTSVCSWALRAATIVAIACWYSAELESICSRRATASLRVPPSPFHAPCPVRRQVPTQTHFALSGESEYAPGRLRWGHPQREREGAGCGWCRCCCQFANGRLPSGPCRLRSGPPTGRGTLACLHHATQARGSTSQSPGLIATPTPLLSPLGHPMFG